VLTRQDGSPALTLTTARVAKDGVVARCVGIETKEAADALRGLRLYVPRSALPEPDEDEFYLTDLIGLTVRHVATNDLIGKIKSVQNFGADDLLEITPGPGRPDLVSALHPRRRARGEDRRGPGPGRSAGDGRRAGRSGRRSREGRRVAKTRSRNSTMTSDGKWRVTASRYIHKDRWIALRADDCLTDDGVPVAPYYVLEYDSSLGRRVLLAAVHVLDRAAGRRGDTDPCVAAARDCWRNRLRRRHDLGSTACTRSWPATSPSRRTTPPNASSASGSPPPKRCAATSGSQGNREPTSAPASGIPGPPRPPACRRG
jgi:hypothetical protein